MILKTTINLDKLLSAFIQSSPFARYSAKFQEYKYK